MSRKEVVHLSGFTEPRTHGEFKQCVETHLPKIPAGTQVRTRGEYNVRMSLHLGSPEAARQFTTVFRAQPVHERIGGAALYVQRDLTHDQRKVGYILRGVRKRLVVPTRRTGMWHRLVMTDHSLASSLAIHHRLSISTSGGLPMFPIEGRSSCTLISLGPVC
eukprot:5968267-Amphidinium_carterae.1